MLFKCLKKKKMCHSTWMTYSCSFSRVWSSNYPPKGVGNRKYIGRSFSRVWSSNYPPKSVGNRKHIGKWGRRTPKRQKKTLTGGFSISTCSDFNVCVFKCSWYRLTLFIKILCTRPLVSPSIQNRFVSQNSRNFTNF